MGAMISVWEFDPPQADSATVYAEDTEVKPDSHRHTKIAPTSHQHFASEAASLFVQLTDVLVGPDEERFTVHTDFLRQLPFFRNCLRVGMRESQENIVRLPEDNPYAFSQLVHWLYTRQFEFNFVQDVSDFHNDDDTHGRFPEPLQAKQDAIINVYLMAKKFCAEELQNYVIDCLRISLEDCLWEPKELQLAFDQQDPQDPLYRMASISMAQEFDQDHGTEWEQIKKTSYYAEFIAGDMEKMEFLLKSLHIHWADPRLTGADDLCTDWHTHIDTPKCRDPMLKHKFPVPAQWQADALQPASHQQQFGNDDAENEDDNSEVPVAWTNPTEIRVGQKQESLYVHTHFLCRLEYFAAMLGNAADHDRTGHLIRVDDFNLKAFDETMAWLLTGRFSFSILANLAAEVENEPSNAYQEHFATLLDIHVLARNLGIERLQNLTINTIRHALRKHYITPKALVFVLEHCSGPDFKLRELVLASLRHKAVNGESWNAFSKTALFTDFADLSKTNMAVVAEAMLWESTRSDDFELEEYKKPCTWHIHERTPQCQEHEAMFLYETEGRHYDEGFDPTPTLGTPGNPGEWLE
jgi:hypothetical protein